MDIDRILIVGNSREEFPNISSNIDKIYNDHLSTNSINFIKSSLNNAGINTNYFGGINELISAYENRINFSANTLFLNLSDGLIHENRKAQACILLELLNVKYIGSDASASLIAANKAFSKSIIANAGINTPQWKLLYTIKDAEKINIKYPLILKPNREGSSIGINQNNYILSQETLFQMVTNLFCDFKELIVEEYIEGYEVTDFIIGNSGDFLLTEAVISGSRGNYYLQNTIFGIEEKANGLREQTLAKFVLPKSVIERIHCYSKRIFTQLGISDFARIDYRVDRNYRIYFLEINTTPVISPTSEIGVICSHNITTPEEILKKMVSTSHKRWTKIIHDQM